MFFALFATGPADLSAEAADVCGVLAVSSHKVGSELANFGAIHVQLDAPSHHFHVIFA